jgi:probable HAF family extracellular repeat protein
MVKSQERLIPGDVVDANTGTPQINAFLWENGKMKDLGNLGDTYRGI